MRPRVIAIALALFAAASPAARAAVDAGPAVTPPPATPPQATPSPAPAAGEEARPRAVAGRIRGTVYDVSRAPRAGIMVQLTSRDRRALLRVTGTDEKGQYLFQDLPAGRYDIEAVAEGLPHEKKEGIEVRPPFQNLVDFRLGSALAGAAGGSAGPGARDGAAPGGPAAAGGPAPGAPAGSGAAVAVRGEFLDQARHPVDEASVTFVALEGGHAYQAFSGPDGGFAIEGVPPGRYRVLVASPGHIGLSLPGVAVLPEVGLDLSLTLVDYPLNFKGRRGDLLPREEPRPAPAPAAPPPASPSSAPSPAPG